MPYIDQQRLISTIKTKDASLLMKYLCRERLLDSIPGAVAWGTSAICIILGLFSPLFLLSFASLVALYTAIRFALATVASQAGLRQIKKWEQIDWHELYGKQNSSTGLCWDNIYHVIIIPNYQEPSHILNQSLEHLAEKDDVKSKFIVVLAMEERERDFQEKADVLRMKFAPCFMRFYVTVHPKNLPGEIPSKSANQTWAARAVWSILQQEGFVLEHLLVTTMDADTLWHPRYFHALTYQFATDAHRHRCIWQGPIRYQANVWDVNPTMRLLNAVASGFELAYMAAPWWQTMPISSYSLSFKLLVESDYWDTDVISDEYHMLIKAYFVSKSQLKVKPIPLPFLAHATTGKTIWETSRMRYQQTLRHAWASKETGYMIAQMIQHPDFVSRGTGWLLFRIAHDVLLAGVGWLVIAIGVQLPLLIHSHLSPPLAELLQTPIVLLQYPYMVILGLSSTIILISTLLLWHHDVKTRPPRPTRKSLTEYFWNLLALPLVPVLTLIFLALPTLHAQTRLMMGMPLAFKVTRKT